jgi:hypothetical protein
MADTSTAVHDVISAVVSGLRAVPGFRSPWATSEGTTVYDTVEVLLSDEAEKSLLIVGWPGRDPVGDANGEAADAAQAIATLGTQQHRDEEGLVRCLAVRQTGDHEVAQGVVPGLRAACTTTTNAVDTWLRANGSLGLVPAYRELTARFGAVTGFRPYVAAGLVAELEFTIVYRARL